MFRGWVRTSLIDYPGHVATVLFTGGCSFRCPMCHNAALVLEPDKQPTIGVDTVWEFLERRKGLVDGIVLTGGEPTLHRDLLPFCWEAHRRELPVKLDTNGYHPEMLSSLLDGGLVDYVAMDVKAPPDKYSALAGLPGIDIPRIETGIALLQQSGIPYEFRTTVVPGMLDEEDIAAIARWIGGADLYVLQQFRPQQTLSPALQKVAPYSEDKLHCLSKVAEPWVKQVTTRGIYPEFGGLVGRLKQRVRDSSP